MLNLKKLREEKGISQAAVARELHISRQAYNNYELGKREADYETLLKLAEFFGTTVDYLLGWSSSPIDFETSEENMDAPLDVIKHFDGDAEKIYNYQKAVEQDYNNEQLREYEKPSASPLPADKIHMIPIFESVSAGFGAYACSDIIDYMPLYFQSPSDVPDTICIKVQGDSMYPKIEDGDIIVVRRQESVDSGSIAVVLVDEEQGYVKKVIYDRETIELHSINPEYAPKIFKGKDVLRVRVVGLVKKIVKEV